MAEYPRNRGDFFAHKLIRLMIRTCACQDIGTDAFGLVTAVVHTEDSKRYTAPVTWWNDQLMSVLGFSWNKLDRARKRAVDAGWLHYEAGGKGKVGKYWATVPEAFAALPDGAVDCDRQDVFFPTGGERNGGEPGTETVSSASSSSPVKRETGEKRERNEAQPGDKCGTFVPSPCPNPIPRKARASPRSFFDDFWEAVHHKTGKRDAEKAHSRAVKRLAAEQRMTAEEAAAMIFERMRQFAQSPRARPVDRSPIHPATWLNKGYYEDDPAVWQIPNGGTGKSNGSNTHIPGPGQRHPDDRDPLA